MVASDAVPCLRLCLPTSEVHPPSSMLCALPPPQVNSAVAGAVTGAALSLSLSPRLSTVCQTACLGGAAAAAVDRFMGQQAAVR